MGQLTKVTRGGMPKRGVADCARTHGCGDRLDLAHRVNSGRRRRLGNWIFNWSLPFSGGRPSLRRLLYPRATTDKCNLPASVFVFLLYTVHF
jgi:hypothetical protein